jgi:hypothetical protein
VSSGERRGLRALEIVAVVLLAAATVGSAWAAYQASQWSGASTEATQESARQRLEASRLFALATQTIAYDADTISAYAQAVATDQPDLARFYRATIARAELLPLMDAWEAEIAAGRTPVGLLDDEEYMAERLGGYDAAIERAEAADAEAATADDTSNSYVLATVLLAVALFFAGVTNTFRMRIVRIVLLGASGMTLAFAVSRMAELGVI